MFHYPSFDFSGKFRWENEFLRDDFVDLPPIRTVLKWDFLIFLAQSCTVFQPPLGPQIGKAILDVSSPGDGRGGREAREGSCCRFVVC